MDTTEHFKNPPTIYASTDDLRRAIKNGTTPTVGLCYFKLSAFKDIDTRQFVVLNELVKGHEIEFYQTQNAKMLRLKFPQKPPKTP